MEAIIFMGVQASGKSTFYWHHFFNSHLRISLDLLNTRNKENKLLQWCLSMQQKCLIDNTNPKRADRERYIPSLREKGFTIKGYYFDVNLDVVLHRNQQRASNLYIPEKGIKSTFNQFEKPDYKEGFDQLFSVQPGSVEMFHVREF